MPCASTLRCLKLSKRFKNEIQKQALANNSRSNTGLAPVEKKIEKFVFGDRTHSSHGVKAHRVF
jgi:hypothetical protein